jgi:hypothetical protein
MLPSTFASPQIGVPFMLIENTHNSMPGQAPTKSKSPTRQTFQVDKYYIEIDILSDLICGMSNWSLYFNVGIILAPFK